MVGGEDIVAIALLNETTFAMLQSSLKRVYRIDNTDRFDDLIRQLDKIDAHKS
jgi:hypothetical protein